MIEDTLEEDLLHEFEGGTLAINPESKANNDKQIKIESSDKCSDNDPAKANKSNYWNSNFISPLACIPSKISATLWTKDSKVASPTKSNSIIQPAICVTENPNNFFTFRESVLARALSECKEQFLDEETDGPLLDAFLLTQISHWNSDKERLVLLTPHTLVICKYDFIALQRLAYRKLPLDLIEEIVYGDLVYPSGSLIPQMNGLFDGISDILETCLLVRGSKNDSNKELNFFKPSNRNMKGVRFVWTNKPSKFTSFWNPFNDDVPFCTFTFHPLFFHKDCDDEKLKNLYCLDVFVEKVTKAVADDLPRTDKPPCTIQEKDIVLQTYVGLGSVIHNRNALGFFKVRGKFSF